MFNDNQNDNSSTEKNIKNYNNYRLKNRCPINFGLVNKIKLKKLNF